MNKNTPNPDDQKRFVVAFVLSLIVLSAFYMLVTKPRLDRAREQAAIAENTAPATTAPSASLALSTPSSSRIQNVDEVLTQSVRRIRIDTPTIRGSFSTTGTRFDDIQLKDYFQTLDQIKPVRLLSPSGTKRPYFVENGWATNDPSVPVPNNATQWTVKSGDTLTSTSPVTLEWNNENGLIFTRTISIDDEYMITINNQVTNTRAAPVTLYPYSLISRTQRPLTEDEEKSFENRRTFILHTGPIAYLNGELNEIDYDDLHDDEDGAFEVDSATGWMGITDKYWLVSLLAEETSDARMVHNHVDDETDVYQADLRHEAVTIPPMDTAGVEQHVFTGAKRLDILNGYEKDFGITHLDLAIDFGWYYFITKPFYLILSFFGQLFSDMGFNASFGLAIIAMTFLLRAATYPLANKAFRSMSMLKKLNPKMKELKKKYGDDRERLQKEIMELYKREKVTPMGGCLPMFIQIPIFFALYKVLYISIEMRHAPFYGWIHDLSSPDPTNVFTLFGLIPIDLPSFLSIGAWPVLYGLSLMLTQRLNPAPNDPVQKQVMVMMPIFFTYFFAQFPAGLVIYFVTSNLLGFMQQYIIQKRMGMNPSIFRRRRAVTVEE